MAITLDIKSELNLAVKWTNEHTKQLPFSIAQAMTAAAKGIKAIPGSQQKSAVNALSAATKRFFESPKPQTVKGWRATTANKRTLSLVILPKDEPWDRRRVFDDSIFGGTRRLKPYEVAFQAMSNGEIPRGSVLVPTGAIKPDKFGNVSRQNLRKITNNLTKTGKGRTYIGTPGHDSKPGVYQEQTKGRMRPLFIAKPAAQYKAIFPAERIAEDKIKSVFGIYLRDRLARNVAANVKAGRADRRTGLF